MGIARREELIFQLTQMFCRVGTKTFLRKLRELGIRITYNIINGKLETSAPRDYSKGEPKELLAAINALICRDDLSVSIISYIFEGFPRCIEFGIDPTNYDILYKKAKKGLNGLKQT